MFKDIDCDSGNQGTANQDQGPGVQKISTRVFRYVRSLCIYYAYIKYQYMLVVMFFFS